jgi:hypothetical protein
MMLPLGVLVHQQVPCFEFSFDEAQSHYERHDVPKRTTTSDPVGRNDDV